MKIFHLSICGMVLAWQHTTNCTSCMFLPLVIFWMVIPSHSHWRWQLHCMVNTGIALTYVHNAAKCWKLKLHIVHKPWTPKDRECLMQCLPFCISSGVWFYPWYLKLKLKNRHVIHTSVTVDRLITLANKDFGPWGKMSVSDVFLDAEFEYVSRISLSPTPFTPG